MPLFDASKNVRFVDFCLCPKRICAAMPSKTFTGRNEGELLRVDFAVRQRLLQFSNLSLGEVGVAIETQRF